MSRLWARVDPIELLKALFLHTYPTRRSSDLDLRDLGIAGENYYYSPRNPPYWRRIEGAIPDLLVRRSVGDKLVGINAVLDRKSTRLNSSHPSISYAVFCLKKKTVWWYWRRVR